MGWVVVGRPEGRGPRPALCSYENLIKSECCFAVDRSQLREHQVSSGHQGFAHRLFSITINSPLKRNSLWESSWSVREKHKCIQWHRLHRFVTYSGEVWARERCRPMFFMLAFMTFLTMLLIFEHLLLMCNIQIIPIIPCGDLKVPPLRLVSGGALARHTVPGEFYFI